MAESAFDVVITSVRKRFELFLLPITKQLLLIRKLSEVRQKGELWTLSNRANISAYYVFSFIRAY